MKVDPRVEKRIQAIAIAWERKCHPTTPGATLAVVDGIIGAVCQALGDPVLRAEIRDGGRISIRARQSYSMKLLTEMVKARKIENWELFREIVQHLERNTQSARQKAKRR